VLMDLRFLSLMDSTLPLHLQTSTPAVVLTVKSSPVKENIFSFMCSVVSCGTQNLTFGPSGGLKGASGAMPGLPSLDLRDNSDLTDRQ
jgi:hypothetical protein